MLVDLWFLPKHRLARPIIGREDMLMQTFSGHVGIDQVVVSEVKIATVSETIHFSQSEVKRYPSTASVQIARNRVQHYRQATHTATHDVIRLVNAVDLLGSVARVRDVENIAQFAACVGNNINTDL